MDLVLDTALLYAVCFKLASNFIKIDFLNTEIIKINLFLFHSCGQNLEKQEILILFPLQTYIKDDIFL